MSKRRSRASLWNGFAPCGKHGADFEGQACTICPPFLPLDLREICRPGWTTNVSAVHRTESRPWLTLGRVELAHIGASTGGAWRFGAHLAQGATDHDHDAAWALSFMLIGVEFGLIAGGMVRLSAYIDPQACDDFRIYPVGVDPFANVTRCHHKDCKRHPFTLYAPPSNPALFEVMRGRRVEIRAYTTEGLT